MFPSTSNTSVAMKRSTVLTATGSSPFTVIGITIAKIQPERRVAAQQSAHCTEYVNKLSHVFVRGLFKANLTLNAIIA
jgi:hypothetical protein